MENDKFKKLRLRNVSIEEYRALTKTIEEGTRDGAESGIEMRIGGLEAGGKLIGVEATLEVRYNPKTREVRFFVDGGGGADFVEQWEGYESNADEIEITVEECEDYLKEWREKAPERAKQERERKERIRKIQKEWIN